jgi:hypothetical protein
VIASWVEKLDDFPSLGICAHGGRPLPHVARATGQRQVFQRIVSTARGGTDVFHLKGKVEHDLWGATVFAAVARPE